MRNAASNVRYAHINIVATLNIPSAVAAAAAGLLIAVSYRFIYRGCPHGLRGQPRRHRGSDAGGGLYHYTDTCDKGWCWRRQLRRHSRAQAAAIYELQPYSATGTTRNMRSMNYCCSSCKVQTSPLEVGTAGGYINQTNVPPTIKSKSQTCNRSKSRDSMFRENFCDDCDASRQGFALAADTLSCHYGQAYHMSTCAGHRKPRHRNRAAR